MNTASTPCPKHPWPWTVPYCKPRRLTISLISKFQNCLSRAKSGKKVFDRGVSASKGRQPSHTVAFSWGTRPRESHVVNRKASAEWDWKGAKRVNLLPLEEGPFDEGEENNLCELQRRQRAIPENKLLCKVSRMICLTVRLFLRSLSLYLALKLQAQGGEKGTHSRSVLQYLSVDSIWDGWFWEAEGEAEAMDTSIEA